MVCVIIIQLDSVCYMHGVHTSQYCQSQHDVYCRAHGQTNHLTAKQIYRIQHTHVCMRAILKDRCVSAALPLVLGLLALQLLPDPLGSITNYQPH